MLLFMVKLSTAVLSHPSELVVTKVYVPLVVYAVSFQVNSSHSVASVVLVKSESMVTVGVQVLEFPLASVIVTVTVFVPTSSQSNTEGNATNCVIPHESHDPPSNR